VTLNEIAIQLGKAAAGSAIAQAYSQDSPYAFRTQPLYTGAKMTNNEYIASLGNIDWSAGLPSDAASFAMPQNIVPGGDVNWATLFPTVGNSLLQGPAIPAEVSTIGAVLKSAGVSLAGSALASLFPSLVQQGGAAPKAGLITGACPPGRVRRTVSFGRDICAKKATMNPLNPKALRRATSRISRFHAFASKAEKEMQKAFRKGGFSAAKRSTGRCTTCRKSKCSCG
jgi:hypothetical protein